MLLVRISIFRITNVTRRVVMHAMLFFAWPSVRADNSFFLAAWQTKLQHARERFSQDLDTAYKSDLESPQPEAAPMAGSLQDLCQEPQAHHHVELGNRIPKL